MSSSDQTGENLSRRHFISGAAAAGVAGSISSASATTETTTAPARVPDAAQIAAELDVPEGYTAEEAAEYFVSRPGSDFMVDVIQSLDVDYMAINAASSFRGLHESLINHGGNSRPEILTCLHEEQAVALAHGYAKVAGKPMMVACHGTVGLQHAAMGLYNAWCDHAPVVVVAGNHLDAAHRRARIEWIHSAQDPAALVRDFCKWDDTPHSLTHFAESTMRAFRIATTPPMGPTVLTLDGELQEMELGSSAPNIPAPTRSRPPQGDSGAVAEAAARLLAAEMPVIVADRYARDQAGMDSLVELAELLGAPVIDQQGRMNFPTNHHLNHSLRAAPLIGSADVVLALEVNDVWGTLHRLRDRVHRDSVRRARDDLHLISISSEAFYGKSNYQDFQRYTAVDNSIAGDAQTTLPNLLEALRRQMGRGQRNRIRHRAEALRAAHDEAREAARAEARFGWDAKPITTARLYSEIWEQVKEQDWALVAASNGQSQWPQRLWPMTRHYQYIGWSGGAGLGYGLPAAVGAALAHREHGRLAINIQPDGDLMFVPGALWTAAHHEIPLLTIMHNNGGYHQEVMHLQRMAARRQRGIDGSARIGNVFAEPTIDFTGLARSMGVWATGPVTEPDDLGPTLAQALEVIASGQPALVDVMCQPR